MLLSSEEIERILREKFAGFPNEKIHEAAEAIVKAHGVWNELDISGNLGAEYSCQCKDICQIGDAFYKGKKIRVFVSNRS
ncbi:MAG TPA: hypothetical protein VI749_04760 [Candidatus Omnitrophota bacterium]|nr:hypothetical protein [Candidatus Omnitrophota bacterium]